MKDEKMNKFKLISISGTNQSQIEKRDETEQQPIYEQFNSRTYLS